MPNPVKSKTKHSDKDEWRTPEDLFSSINDFFRFNLDAAATADNALCDAFISQDKDSLSTTPWSSYSGANHTRAWLNPPYSKTREFLGRARLELNYNNVVTVAIVRADAPETGWWNTGVLFGSRLAFDVIYLTPRVNFTRPDGKDSAGNVFPCCLIVYRKIVSFRSPAPYWWHWKRRPLSDVYTMSR